MKEIPAYKNPIIIKFPAWIFKSCVAMFCSAPSSGLPAGKVRSDRKKAFPLEVPRIVL